LPYLPSEERSRERFEFLRRLPAAARVSVARQIDQVERPASLTRIYRRARHTIQIREPRHAGRCAGARQALANQRIDQARFADVRTSDERDPREAVVRNISRVGRAANESGFDSQ
jgi:hypothetical protein